MTKPLVIAAVFAGLISLLSGAAAVPESPVRSVPVGQLGPNLYSTPVNQLLTPAGRQLELPGLRPQALALSPNGKLLAISGKTSELVLADPRSGGIIQRLALPRSSADEPNGSVSRHILQPDKDAEVSYTGLRFSPDGTRLYLASVNGTIKVFAFNREGKASPFASFSLPHADVPGRKLELPAGLAVSPNGQRLYVAGNLSNRLLELDAATGQLLRAWDVGVAPYEVVLAGHKAYVSNWGGPRPGPVNVTGPAGRGTWVRVDSVRYVASEGSVTVIDLVAGQVIKELITGLHASALALSPSGRQLVVANAASDTLSVMDTRKDEVVETISMRASPGDPFGASPNALAFDRSGKRLFVCNATQNAVSMVSFSPGKSKVLGLIPVGWFPGAIQFDPRRESLCVANIKGIGATRRLAPGAPVKFNSHEYFGTVSFVQVPSAPELAEDTALVMRNLRRPLLDSASLPARPGVLQRPVPERVGEPSVFKHVVYIIKENRTYDQVLGDISAGNGDPSLCIFGEKFTPNQHQLAKEFVLLDNTYCSGNVSADGHQWADSAITTDYMEKSFAGFPRSYPDGMGDDEVDALAYSPAGFIWDNAIAHGRKLRDYGEFAITETSWTDKSRKGKIGFAEHWRDFTHDSPALRISSRPAIESLRPFLCTNTVGWDLDIPDVFRARQFIRELHEYEARHDFPNLVLICLPNDHTSGTSPRSPTPGAQVADNDLAFGQIVDALSHSSFWAETCILAIEDDPQNGWDHVSAYRTTAYVVSPYTKRHAVVSTQYNQTSLLRTIELMLGLPPMNQMDATATPMTDCFAGTPDLTPYTAVTNNIPLNQMNPEPKKVTDALLRRDAVVSSRLPLEAPDRCPEDLLNRILWHAMKGTQTPYPQWAVSSVADSD